MCTYWNRLIDATIMSTHIIHCHDKISLNYSEYIHSWGYECISLETLERIRNSHSKRAVGVRVIEVSLQTEMYMSFLFLESKQKHQMHDQTAVYFGEV